MAKKKTIRDLLVRLGVNADTAAAKNFDRAIGDVKATMVKVATTAAAAAAAIGAFVKSTANAGDEASMMAQSLGITVEAAQELAFVFERFRLEGDDVSDVFNTLTDRAEDAKSGMQSFIDDFKLIGVEVADLKDKDPAALFDLFADKIEKTADVNRRNTAVVRLLGDDLGRKLIPLLSQGSAGIERFRAEARAMGVVMSKDATDASRKFNSSLVLVKGILTGLRNQIGLAFMPAMTETINRIKAWYVVNRDIIKQRLDKTLETIARSMSVVKAVAADLWSEIDQLAQKLGGWDVVLTTVSSTLATIAAYKFWGMLVGAAQTLAAILGVLSIKAVLVAAAFIGIVAVVQDVITYLRGGESETGKFLEWLNSLEIVEDVRAWFSDLANTISGFFEQFAQNERVVKLRKILGELYDVIASVLEPAIESIMGLIRTWWDTAKTYFTLIGEIAAAVVQKIFEWWWDYVKRVFDVVSTVFGLIADFLLGWWDNVLLPLFRFLGPIVSEAISAVVGIFTAGFESIGDVLKLVLGLVRGEFDSFGDFIGEAVGVFKRHWARVFDWFADRIKYVISRFNSARSLASNLPGLGFLGGDDGGAAGAAASNARAENNRNIANSVGGVKAEINIDARGSNVDAEDVASRVQQGQEDVLQTHFRHVLDAYDDGPQ